MVIAQDPEKRGSATDKLSVSDDRFRLFATETREGVIIHDLVRILAVNDQFARMFGSTVERIVGSDPFRFVVPEDRGEVEARARRHETVSIEAQGMRLDGTRFPVESTSRTIIYRGQAVRIVRIRDLSHQKAVEATLDANEERFKATFELAAIGVAHVAPNGAWLKVNQRLCEMVGYTEEELLQRTFQDLTYPDDLDADLEQVDAVLAGRIETYSMEKRYIRKDGSIVWANLRVALARRPGGAPDYFISVVEDISARKSMEERLRQSQKMEIMGQLTSSIAHDFGNALNVIKGNLQLLERYLSESRPMDYVASALAGADLAERLIRQLLQFSRREEARPEMLDVNRVVIDLGTLLRRAAGKGVTLTIALEDEPCLAVCDRTQLETALLNLVLNARDAILPSAGEISVVTAHDGNGRVRLTVSDTGGGMPPDVIERACDPFFTTKAPGIGTGLGLSQVARFMNDVEGALDIASTVGSGTTVSLLIPRYRNEALPAAAS